MGASCCKAAADDGPEAVQESFGSSRKEFSRSPLKGHGSDAQFSAESTPRKIQDGSIGAPHDRYDRDTPNSNLAIESKSTTSEGRSASSSTCSHDYGPTTEPICVSKLSTIHSASLSQPDRSPQSDASPLSHFPTCPSISSPRVSPVLSGNPHEVVSVNALDSIGDVELPNDVFVRRNSAPADDSDAATKISPRGPVDDDSAEVTAAFGFDSPEAGASGITARNSYPVFAPSSRGRPPADEGDGGYPDFQVHLPHVPDPELLSDAAASRFLAQSHSSFSEGSECDTLGAAVDASDGTADAALGVEPRPSRLHRRDGAYMDLDTAGAALEEACILARETTASELESPFATGDDPSVMSSSGGAGLAMRRTVSGGVVTGIPASRGTGRASARGRGGGALTAKERALRTAPEPFRAGGRVGMRQRGGRTGQGRRGGRSSFPMANSQFDTVGSAQDDPFESVTSMPEARNARQPGRGRGRRPSSALASASPSASAFSLPGYQATNSLTDSQMADMQAGSGFTPTASPSSQSPAHYFGAPQQFVPGGWGMMPGSPMMGGGMVMPGSPGLMMPGSPGMMPGGSAMMAGGYNGMQPVSTSRGGTPTAAAASPSSASSQRRGLSPELAALLGRDGQPMNGMKGGQMQLSRQQQKQMMRQQRRLHSMGSIPMNFSGTPQQMAHMQMAAQQQQMALQMNPMNGHMMMSPQHSRSSSASSFSLNQPLRQGVPMRSGSTQSTNHHSMSPHHSASPQHMAMGGRHVSMGSSEDSSGGQNASAAGKGTRAAHSAGTAAGRGAKRGGAAGGRGRGAGPASNGMHQKSASYGGGLMHATGKAQPPASAYAQGGPLPSSRANMATARR